MSSNFEKARDLVLKYGWNTTCFQIVNPGIKYWFGDDGESVVGYVDAKRMRVVAGAPVCPEKTLSKVVSEFEQAAKKDGRGVCYFGAEARLEAALKDSPDHSRILLGAQPVWQPVNWASIMAGRKSLRAQFNRARNKSVLINEWSVADAANDPRLSACLKDWFTLKGLPPLQFMIEPNTLGRLENRRIFVAERDDIVEAFLVLSPIPERNGWLTEQFPHRPTAPNGTVELMMDTAVRQLASEDYDYVTLGLSPLSKRANIKPFNNPFWLRFTLAWARKHGQRFYNFDGLDAFKAKMTPEFWEPVFAFANRSDFSVSTLYAIAAAFTGDRPISTFARGIGRAIKTEIKWLRPHIG